MRNNVTSDPLPPYDGCIWIQNAPQEWNLLEAAQVRIWLVLVAVIVAAVQGREGSQS